LEPSDIDNTYVKNDLNNTLIDESKAPLSILFDGSFGKLWVDENVNGIYHRISDKLYTKPALYDSKTNMTLEFSGGQWTFRNREYYGNETVIAFANSTVYHPGLFQYTHTNWNVLDIIDTTDLNKFPTSNRTEEYMSMNIRNVSLYFQYLNLKCFRSF